MFNIVPSIVILKSIGYSMEARDKNLKMYASNEEEDWVYLHQTPPRNTISGGATNLTDRKRSYSSSSSSITSCSSQSNRSISLSSICSTELEQVQANDINVLSTPIRSAVEQENSLLETTNIEESILRCRYDKDTQTTIDKVDAEIQTNQTLPLTNSIFPNSKSFSLPQRRHSTGAITQRTDLYINVTRRLSTNTKSSKRIEINDTFISCTCIMVLLIFSFILGQIVAQWDQSTMNRISKELDKTNQRLNEVQDIPSGNIEEKLAKQLEDKLQNMVTQQLAWRDIEKDSFLKQIRELRQILSLTQHNLTNTIHQLTDENERLQQRIKSIEHREEENYSKVRVEGVNFTNSSRSTVDQFVSNVFKQTISIAGNTSIHFSGLFAHLSASVSNFVDHRHEYMNKSKQKLSDFARSSTAEKVQITLRQSVENLSTSFRKARSTYSSWFHARTHHREHYSWRWNFRRNENEKHACYSKLESSINKIRSMKNWMIKIFRA
ncbi:hypothetical protein I4U23_026420 [Adineta vaga]|nr:hypothetical protein I4U23_026420 [Adineta vaga]